MLVLTPYKLPGHEHMQGEVEMQPPGKRRMLPGNYQRVSTLFSVLCCMTHKYAT